MLTFVKINYIVKLANNYYQLFCTLGEINVPTASFNPCFNRDAPNHGIDSCPDKKDQKTVCGEQEAVNQYGTKPRWKCRSQDVGQVQ